MTIKPLHRWFLPAAFPFLSLPFLALSFLSVSSQAHDFSGYVGAEYRYFLSDPLFDDQSDHNGSLSFYAEYYHDFDDGDQRIAFTGFARADSEDSERSHGDIRELYWWGGFDQFEVYAGIRKIFWGVTESVHLVDIVNQSDIVENFDGEDKLGQPMIEFVTAQDWGTINAYILPYFRERNFPGKNGRLRAGVPILEDEQYQDSDEQQHVDYALRWSHYFGIWDIGLSHFSGTSRTPLFVPTFLAGESGTDAQFVGVTPTYQQIEQTGLDVQATMNAWLMKLEVISIDEKDWGRNTAVAGGIEYTWFTIAQTNADLGLVVEYQFDDRRDIRRTTTQNDIVIGARWAFNDLDGSELLVLASQDLDVDNRFFSAEVTRRLNDDWKIEAEARFLSSIEEGTPEYDLRDDDYIQLELRRYF